MVTSFKTAQYIQLAIVITPTLREQKLQIVMQNLEIGNLESEFRQRLTESQG